MSNLATLSVGLLVNAVSFKSAISDAYRYAGQESDRFSRRASEGVKKTEQSYHSLGSAIKSVSGQLALLAGTGFSLGVVINTTRQYSQALSDLSAITGATGEQLKAFDKAAQQMGRTTEYTASQAATALKLMASAKPELMKTSDGLIKATNSALILAQAGGTTLPDATRTLALSLNQFGASAAEADRYINVLAAGAKYGSSEITNTAAAIKNGGVAAAQARVSFEELNAAIQVLAEREVKAGEAGTALRNVILMLERGGDKTLKPSVVGLSVALENLGKKSLSTTSMVKMFGLENVNAATILTKNVDKLNELKTALTGTNTAFEQAKTRTDNLNGDLLSLTSAFEGMIIQIGQSADGPLRTGIQAVTGGVNTLTDNFSTLANVAAYAVLPVIGGRLTSSLQAQAKEWYQLESASRSAARQQAETAKRAIDEANATIKLTEVQGKYIRQQELENPRHGVYVNYAKEKSALIRQETEALAKLDNATQKLAQANRKLSFSTRAWSASLSVARGALSLIGGPLGAAMLAGSAIYYLHQQQEQAKQSAIELGRSTDQLIDSLRTMNNLEVNKRLFDTQDDIVKQKEAIEEQKKLVEARRQVMLSWQTVSKGRVKAPFAPDATKKAAEATRIYKNEVNNLGLMQEGLSKKQSDINLLQARHAGLLRDNYVEIVNITDTLPLMTAAGSEFNRILSTGNKLLQERQELSVAIPLALPASTETQAELNRLQQQIELEKLQGVERAMLAAEQRVKNQDKSDRERVRNKAAELYRLQQANKEKGNKGKEDKTELNHYQQLRREIESAHTTSLQRIIQSEQETLKKLNELDKSGVASHAEVQHLKLLNAENHEKQRLDLAEKYAPVKALVRHEQEANAELKSLYDARLLTEQEYLSASKTLYQDSTKQKLAEQAKQYTAPRIDMAGEVDPVVQLKNQLAEQQALYDAYYQNGIISKERYEQLVTAATNKSKGSQLTAAKELYASQGNFQKMQMNLLDTVEQRTGNALTGMLMGTKSFSDSLKELTASLAQSIIQDLIRIAMQAMITNAVSGLFGGFSGGGAAASSAGASSAGTGAMGMSTSWKSYVPNAKGGIYNSPSLSAYSGQIVSNPTLFAFAKGATGLMGEAGPEAILPLKRGPDGALGVRASSSNAPAVSAAPQVYITINNEQTESQTSSGWEQFGSSIGQFVDGRYRELRDRDLRPGGPLWRR
ncbi:phage tail tape measure protein [Photorhabdus khanii]|uniref:Phage tail tape measure protein n=1 Tax=Photorhabdus khanii subsp. guanajuatensis TaxID=2100166 RepID=A0A4R4JTB7_9GAMM|nr:phage tail tape measure protein [Photorhabdus khanii]TDB57246.1 phage tail tape measure protein [Photorhabdus khanii subsp. guanajuatensis]